MFKKTKVREILELLNKGLSAREIAKVLAVSRNSVASVKEIYDQCDKDWDEIKAMSDDELYSFFYPHKFYPRNRFAPVDYAYVHKELKRVGVTEMLLWQEYCARCDEEGVNHCCYTTFANGYRRYVTDKNYTTHIEHKPGITLEVDWSGPTMSYIDPDKRETVTAYLFVATFPYSQYTYVEAATSMDEANWLTCNIHMLEFFEGVPVKIICDNLKTGVTSHPKHGEIVLNEAYLSFAEHYNVAILPAGVKKPKQKASVEGSVGKIARKIIGMLRNETFNSLEGLNTAIRKALDKLNNAPFQKREGNRKTVFELEEKPALRPLPLIPYEACSWSYGHKVGPDSHIWFKKGQYSVPCAYINKSVDVRYSSSHVFLYHSHELIARHRILPDGSKNGRRTDPAHLPYPSYTPDTAESISQKAKDIGFNTYVVITRIFENARVKEQGVTDARPILGIASAYGEECLEVSCKNALKDFHLVTYSILMKYVKAESKAIKNDTDKTGNDTGKKTAPGIIRGADYYRKDGK